jgi:hypothetical protein
MSRSSSYLSRLFNKTLLYGTTFLLGAAFAGRSLMRRGRATHTVGLGLSGKLTVVDNPPLPANGFFRAGREFPILVRHAIALRSDEMERDFRSMAIKLSGSESTQALDLVMNTGNVQGFWHGANFIRGAIGGALGEFGRRWYIKNNPPAFDNINAGIRRSPDSFTQISYYAAISFEFVALDTTHHLVRFRVIPENRQEDSGISVGKDLERPWHEERSPNEYRGCYWLSEEARARIRSGKKMNYILQVQSRPITQDPQAYDIGREWEPSEFPWNDLARIALDRLLDPEVTEGLTFRIDHQPTCLSIPVADSPWDYRSIGWMRPRIYRYLQALRWSIQKLRRLVLNSTVPKWDREGVTDEHEWRRPHSFTTLLEVKKEGESDLIEELTRKGDSLNNQHAASFRDVRSLHFLRMQVVHLDKPHLLIDLVHDRSIESHLDEFLLHEEHWLEPLLKKYVAFKGSMRRALLNGQVSAQTFHTGDRSGKAVDVLAEQRLREAVNSFLDMNLRLGIWKPDASAETIRKAIRSHILSLSDPSLPFRRRDRRTLRAILKKFFHAVIAFLNPWSGLLHDEVRRWLLPKRKRVSVLPRIGSELLLAFHFTWTYLPTRWFLWQVRKMEKIEAEGNQTLSKPRNYQQVVAREEFQIQNPLTVVGVVKQRGIRPWLLSKILAGANDASCQLWDRGELAGINTIHTARILQLKRGGQMIFMSDYDGSWERYLSDFLTVGAKAVVPIFSNLEDCPATTSLFDPTPGFADKFREFIRNYQEPVHLWYSAWPTLSLKNRLANARLRDGLFVEHMSEKQAAEWAQVVL